MDFPPEWLFLSPKRRQPELQSQLAACNDGYGQLQRQRWRIRQILGGSEILKVVFSADLLFGLEFSMVADLEAYHIHLSFWQCCGFSWKVPSSRSKLQIFKFFYWSKIFTKFSITWSGKFILDSCSGSFSIPDPVSKKHKSPRIYNTVLFFTYGFSFLFLCLLCYLLIVSDTNT